MKLASVASALEGLVATPARARVAGGLGLGAIGAGVGAVVDKKHRGRGALVGGLLGGTTGALSAPGLLRRTKWAEPGDVVSWHQDLANRGGDKMSRNGRVFVGVQDGGIAGPDADELRGVVNDVSSITRRLDPRAGRSILTDYTSAKKSKHGMPAVEVGRAGRGMVAEVFTDHLDAAGRHSGVTVARTRARFGQSPAEFAQEALDYARKTYPELSFSHTKIAERRGLAHMSTKAAGLPIGAGNILANIGSAVTRGATKAVSAVANTAPQTAARFAPQIASGIGLMARHSRAVGGAALGAGAATIGGGLAAMRQ